MQTLVIVALVLAALLLYGLWSLIDSRRGRRAASVAADVAALGEDAVPASIHPVIDPQRCIGSGACISACPEKEVIGLVGGQAALINPLACIGHGACMAACPVQAIDLVFGTAHRGVELPQIGPDFQTNQPGVYVVGELGGMGLIRNAMVQGRQVGEAIAQAGRRGGAGALDALVVGAGPAGIASTLSLMEQGLRVLLIDQEEFGGTIRHYPRAKVAMTGALEVPRYGKVRRKTMSKEQLLALWDDIRETTGLPFEKGLRVDRLAAEGAGAWVVEGDGWQRRAANVVLALGRRGTPRRLGVPGEEQSKVHYRLLEPEPFAGKHVLVVGGGNSAAETAIALADFGGCASLALSYRRTELARLRSQVRQRIDAAIASGRVRALMPTEVTRIGEREVELAAPGGGSPQTIANDAVIVQIGGTAPDALLAKLGIATVTKRGEA